MKQNSPEENIVSTPEERVGYRIPEKSKAGTLKYSQNKFQRRGCILYTCLMSWIPCPRGNDRRNSKVFVKSYVFVEDVFYIPCARIGCRVLREPTEGTLRYSLNQTLPFILRFIQQVHRLDVPIVFRSFP